MITLLVSMFLAHQSKANVDPGLPPDEYATMSSVLANYPGDPGTVYYIDESGTAHSNRVGALSNLVSWQPVADQPNTYTDGAETVSAPTTGQTPPTSIPALDTLTPISEDPTIVPAYRLRAESGQPAANEGRSTDAGSSPFFQQPLPPSVTGPYRRVVCGLGGVAMGYCDGVLASNANLNAMLTGRGSGDSAYMDMTPWSYSKPDYANSKYWTTGGDFGFKFSHSPRLWWETIARSPGRSPS